MAKPSDTHLPEVLSSSATIAKEFPSEHLSAVTIFLRSMGVSEFIPDNCNTKDFYSDLVRAFLKPDRVLRGRVTCLLTISPAVTVTLVTLLFASFSTVLLYLFCFWFVRLKFELFVEKCNFCVISIVWFENWDVLVSGSEESWEALCLFGRRKWETKRNWNFS